MSTGDTLSSTRPEEVRLPPWTRVLLDSLTRRGREAFVLRETGLTFTEIGDRMNISTSRARQLHEASSRRMTNAARRAVLYARHAGVVETHAGGSSGCVAERCPVPAGMTTALDLPLLALPIGVRAVKCLESADIRHVVQRTDLELLRILNLGRKRLREIRNALAELELHLAMDVGSWSPPRATDVQ